MKSIRWWIIDVQTLRISRNKASSPQEVHRIWTLILRVKQSEILANSTRKESTCSIPFLFVPLMLTDKIKELRLSMLSKGSDMSTIFWSFPPNKFKVTEIKD